MGAAFQRMLSAFYTRQLEVVLVGLENSGKTTLMNGERAASAWYASAKRETAVQLYNYRPCCRDRAFSCCCVERYVRGLWCYLTPHATMANVKLRSVFTLFARRLQPALQ